MAESKAKPAAKRSRTTSRGTGKATTPSRRKPRGTTKRRKAGREYSIGIEILRIALNCLGILFGLLVLGLSIGAWYGTRLATDVLQEIGERDFVGAKEQIHKYKSFLESLDTDNYEVNQGKTNITQGLERHTWVVKLRGSSELRRFQWVHDYKESKVRPLTNPALCLDIELGYVTEAVAPDVELAANQVYDPDDVITRAIVKNNFSIIQTQYLSGGDGWTAGNFAEGAVGAPRITPAEAAGREAAAKAQALEDEELDEDQTPELGDATDVYGAADESSTDD